MTTESVAASATESVSAHLRDAVHARLAKIIGIANMLMDVDPSGMADHSLANTAWTIADLAQEAHDLMGGTAEVQS